MVKDVLRVFTTVRNWKGSLTICNLSPYFYLATWVITSPQIKNVMRLYILKSTRKSLMLAYVFGEKWVFPTIIGKEFFSFFFMSTNVRPEFLSGFQLSLSNNCSKS